MGRYYHFSKKLSAEQADEIVRELKEVETIEKVSITEDNLHLLVTKKDNEFTEVMGLAVNICSRAANVELTFEKFAV